MKEKLKVLSLFSGIGAFEKALTNLNIDYELVGFSEIDKWAIKSYCAIHNVSEDLNLGDISKIKNEGMASADLVTYGFPCQDISVAGLQEGIKEGTRSGLLYEAERVIKTIKPRYAIAENVKNLVGKKHKKDFEDLLKRLEGYGYNNYWKVLNAKDYGSAQSRERVFVVSIRKDIDNGNFSFNDLKMNKNVVIKDILEEDVGIKYNVPREMIQNWYKKKPPFGNRFSIKNKEDKACTLVAKSGRAVITNNYICTTDEDFQTLKNIKNKESLKEILEKDIEIRALTPLEYFRLQGFNYEDFKSVEKITSDAQIYKQAGNSISVNVLEAIFKELFKERINE